MQRGLGGAEGHTLGFSRVWGVQQDPEVSSGFTRAQWGQKEGEEAQQGAVGCCGEEDLFSITRAPALPQRWGEGGEEECGWGLLGLLQTLPAPSLALSLRTRCFQGRGCRIQCKRQRHDLHVKLNSP